MDNQQLQQEIKKCIIEENGHMTTEELAIAIHGKYTNRKRIDIAECCRKYDNKLFKFGGRGIGWTLTDKQWDEVRKEKNES